MQKGKISAIRIETPKVTSLESLRSRIRIKKVATGNLWSNLTSLIFGEKLGVTCCYGSLAASEVSEANCL